jgi:hypothetical protein
MGPGADGSGRRAVSISVPITVTATNERYESSARDAA